MQKKKTRSKSNSRCCHIGQTIIISANLRRKHCNRIAICLRIAIIYRVFFTPNLHILWLGLICEAHSILRTCMWHEENIWFPCLTWDGRKIGEKRCLADEFEQHHDNDGLHNAYEACYMVTTTFSNRVNMFGERCGHRRLYPAAIEVAKVLTITLSRTSNDVNKDANGDDI